MRDCWYLVPAGSSLSKISYVHNVYCNYVHTYVYWSVTSMYVLMVVNHDHALVVLKKLTEISLFEHQ